MEEEEEEEEESSSSDDEGVAADLGASALTTLLSLEQQLAASPWSGEAHGAYVAQLRRCRLRAKLSAAHEAWDAALRLPDAAWLAWIEDEERRGCAAFT